MHLKQITGNDLHGHGVNQPNGDVYTNATKHYDRDAFETNNTGNDLHGRGANQQEVRKVMRQNINDRDAFEQNITNKTTLVMIYMVEVRINKKT